jgi:lipoprotein signal peptidase
MRDGPSEFWIAIWTALILLALVVIIKLLLEHSIRRKLIERDMVDENVRYLFYHNFRIELPSNLKWGFVSIAIGLSVFFGQFLAFEKAEEVTIGSMFVLVGAGLVLYYFIANRIFKRLDTEKKE